MAWNRVHVDGSHTSREGTAKVKSSFPLARASGCRHPGILSRWNRHPHFARARLGAADHPAYTTKRCLPWGNYLLRFVIFVVIDYVCQLWAAYAVARHVQIKQNQQ